MGNTLYFDGRGASANVAKVMEACYANADLARHIENNTAIIALWGRKPQMYSWEEHLLSERPEHFAQIVELAQKDGYYKFRISVDDSRWCFVLGKDGIVCKSIKSRNAAKELGDKFIRAIGI